VLEIAIVIFFIAQVILRVLQHLCTASPFQVYYSSFLFSIKLVYHSSNCVPRCHCCYSE